MTGVLIAVACLIVFLVLVFVVNHLAPPELKEKTMSELSATKEGREELARMMGAKYGRVPKKDFELCPDCEGHGRGGHGTSIINGVATFVTWGQICQSCDGTGIKGGLSYVVLDCLECEGTGAKDGVKCGMCQGTKVVRKDKSESHR